MTVYPSDIMDTLTGVMINPAYSGRDPIRELIDAAHAKNIKVVAWFEYGFAAQNGSPGAILQARPEWAAKDVNGNTLVKNGFYWMNPMRPDVQNFMIALFMEVVRNYPDIDGVQGDDRLPAMPSEGGYDDYTVSLYQSEHGGNNPPNTGKNIAWLKWRADILSAFAARLYDSVKMESPGMMVAASPSPYGFGYDEYLQDYNVWMDNGDVDIVSPQLYRRESQGINVYNSLLNAQLDRIGREHTAKFFPGILLYLGGEYPSAQFLVDVIRANRAQNVTGEVYFFGTGLQVPELQEAFRTIYPAKALYPDL